MRCIAFRTLFKSSLSGLLCGGLIALAGGCSPRQEPATKAQAANQEVNPKADAANSAQAPSTALLASHENAIVLSVDGMACDGCADDLRSLLEDQPGVAKVEVSFKESRAVIVPTATDGATAAGLCEAVHRELSLKVSAVGPSESDKTTP